MLQCSNQTFARVVKKYRLKLVDCDCTRVAPLIPLTILRLKFMIKLETNLPTSAT